MCTPGPYSCAAPNAGVSPGYFCQRHRSFVRTPLGGPDETQPPQVTILPAGGACGASVGDRDRDGARQLVQPLTGAQPGISATPGVDPHAGHQHEEPAGGWAGAMRCGESSRGCLWPGVRGRGGRRVDLLESRSPRGRAAGAGRCGPQVRVAEVRRSAMAAQSSSSSRTSSACSARSADEAFFLRLGGSSDPAPGRTPR